MGDITYMTGQQLSQAVVEYGTMVSGMTAAEAAAALGSSSYATQGGGKISSFPMQYFSGGKPVTLEAQYAAQTWNYYKIAAGAAGITSLGAAASAAKSWASGVLFGDPALAGTLAGTGGLLTMTLPTAAAVAAPLLGVSLGGALYESNPEFWTKVSQKLLPWAYEDTFDIGAVVDNLGQVFLPKGLIDDLADLFEEEGIGQDSYTRATDPDYPDWYVYGYQSYTRDDGTYISSLTPGTTPNDWCIAFLPDSTFPDGADMVYVAKGPGNTIHQTMTEKSTGRVLVDNYLNLNLSGTINGKIVYYTYTDGISEGFDKQMSEVGTATSIYDLVLRVGEIYFYGTQTPVGGDYPEGTSRWTGNSVDLSSLTPAYVITDPNTGETQPYYPVTLPTGDPTVSPDPEVEPDPTAPVELPELNPYISPKPIPEAWPAGLPEPDPDELVSPTHKVDPIYIPDIDLDPSIDPSVEPHLDPAEDIPQEADPTSTGQTPPILFPPVNWPSIVPSSGSGLIHVYNPTPAEFISFGNWLWVTYADPSIEKLWNNPFDGVIGAHELYATPSNDGTDTIKSGFLDSGISSAIVRQRYTSINCGSIVIPEYWGNYLDYSPYSKAYVYLPFIGIVELDVDDIVGHSINILYHVDSYNGSCIAQITVARDNYTNTIYQFSGNCAVDLPLAGGSQAAIRSGMISAAAYGIGSTLNGVVNGAAFGGIAGAIIGGITGAVGGVSSGVANVVSQKSTVQHSGSFGASYGAMGIKYPYIIIRRPVQKEVNRYQDDYGFPAHKRVIIGECSGFLRVKEVNVQSTLATDDEKTMIENLLKAGVYIS